MTPARLSVLIAEALRAVDAHADHVLLPVYRQDIFLALKFHPHESRFRARLGLALVRHLLATWTASGAMFPEFGPALQVLEQLGQSGDDHTRAWHATHALWRALEPAGAAWIGQPQERGWFVAQTLASALREALGRDPLYDCHFDIIVTDEQLDPWESDGAKWAAIAWAGRADLSWNDSVRRRAFWHWWLTVALPDALGTPYAWDGNR